MNMDGHSKRTNVVHMVVPDMSPQESGSGDSDKDFGLHQYQQQQHQLFTAVPLSQPPPAPPPPTTAAAAEAITATARTATTTNTQAHEITRIAGDSLHPNYHQHHQHHTRFHDPINPSTAPHPHHPSIVNKTHTYNDGPSVSNSNCSLRVELSKLICHAWRILINLSQRRVNQKIVLTMVFSGTLTSAAFHRGFQYTPPTDVVVYCAVYSMWVTTCLPWLLLHLDAKTMGVIAGVLLRLFAADIVILGYAAWRGDTHIFHRGLRLKPLMESSLSWLSEAGYSLRFAVVVASVTATLAKLVTNVVYDYFFSSPGNQGKKRNTNLGNNCYKYDAEKTDEEKGNEQQQQQLQQQRSPFIVRNKVKKDGGSNSGSGIGNGLIRHTIIKGRPTKSRRGRDCFANPSPSPSLENPSSSPAAAVVAVPASRPQSRGNLTRHHNSSRPWKFDSCGKQARHSRGDSDNHSPSNQGGGGGGGGNVASSSCGSPATHKKVVTMNGAADAAAPKTNAVGFAPHRQGVKNLSNDSPPVKFRGGATKNYSRLGKEKRGGIGGAGGYDAAVEVRPWKKTNPTLFSPARSWQSRNANVVGLEGHGHAPTSRFMRFGDNISFNKSTEIESDVSGDTAHAQNVRYDSRPFVEERMYGGELRGGDTGEDTDDNNYHKSHDSYYGLLQYMDDKECREGVGREWGRRRREGGGGDKEADIDDIYKAHHSYCGLLQFMSDKECRKEEGRVGIERGRGEGVETEGGGGEEKGGEGKGMSELRNDEADGKFRRHHPLSKTYPSVKTGAGGGSYYERELMKKRRMMATTMTCSSKKGGAVLQTQDVGSNRNRQRRTHRSHKVTEGVLREYK